MNVLYHYGCSPDQATPQGMPKTCKSSRQHLSLNFSLLAPKGTIFMKLSRLILGGAAIVATALTAFAFTSSNRFSLQTLATWNGSVYTNVPCARSGGTTACSSTTTTYYTRGANHTKVGNTAFIVAE
jgi:hypothetical protein